MTTTTRTYQLSLATVALIALTACARDAEVAVPVVPDSSGILAVDARVGSLSGPDTVASGWQRLRVTEDVPSHIVVAFRMPDAATASDVEAFLVALDSTPNTPLPAVALGGPEIGATGEVVIDLKAGRYVLACVARGDDGHRHARSGESHTFIAVASSDAPDRAAPAATIEVDMIDFAYTGNERWPAGSQVLQVRNNGAQDHQLRLARLNDGVTLRQVMDASNPMQLMRNVAGVARMSAGQLAYLSVDLTPGTYLLTCLVTDPKTGRQHIDLGMVRAVTVE